MNEKNNEDVENKEQEKLLRELNSINIIIEIERGEINVITSGNLGSFIIVNKDAKKIALKKIRDPFMNIPFVIKTYLEKWSLLPKKK